MHDPRHLRRFRDFVAAMLAPTDDRPLAGVDLGTVNGDRTAALITRRRPDGSLVFDGYAYLPAPVKEPRAHGLLVIDDLMPWTAEDVLRLRALVGHPKRHAAPSALPPAPPPLPARHNRAQRRAASRRSAPR